MDLSFYICCKCNEVHILYLDKEYSEHLWHHSSLGVLQRTYVRCFEVIEVQYENKTVYSAIKLDAEKIVNQDGTIRKEIYDESH